MICAGVDDGSRRILIPRSWIKARETPSPADDEITMHCPGSNKEHMDCSYSIAHLKITQSFPLVVIIDRDHNANHGHPKHYTIPYTVSSRNHVIRSEAHFPSPRSLQNLRFPSSSPPTPSSPVRFLLFHLSVCGFRSCAFSGVVLFRRSVLVRGSPFPLVSTPLSSSAFASIPHSPHTSNPLGSWRIINCGAFLIDRSAMELSIDASSARASFFGTSRRCTRSIPFCRPLNFYGRLCSSGLEIESKSGRMR